MLRIRSRQDAGWRGKVVGSTRLRPWLQERGSLTARLKRHYPAFSVQLLRQGWRKPHYDELALLSLHKGVRAWVREVLLTGNAQPRVFAHSVIARQDLRSAWYGLRKIERLPLGAALFANPRVQRGALHFLKLPQVHPLRKTISAHLPDIQKQTLWARRSLFCLRGQRLLVTEVFLPNCIESGKVRL